MKANTSRLIRLDPNPKHKGLYDRALQEVNQEGEQIGSDQIPWTLGHNFDVTDFSVRCIYSAGKDDAPEEQIISATLLPSVHNRGRRPSYSMFGTDRTIASIKLYIRSHQPSEEHPYSWGFFDGFVSYTNDDPLWGETVPDHLNLNLGLTEKEFASLVRQIEQGTVTAATLRFHAHGFYSNWTPDISTDEFKVLGRDVKDQPVEDIDEGSDQIHRLGEVWDISLCLEHSIALAVAVDEPDDGDWQPEEDFIDQPEDGLAKPPQSEGVGVASVQALQSIKAAAWIIAVLLLIGLFV